MMRLSNLADYAVVAMVALARSDVRMSAGRLAADTGIPTPTAAKLTVLLTKSGLLDATRGAHGGVSLARSAAGIGLVEIVEAVDGPIALTTCLHDGADDCVIGAACQVRPHWPVINRKVRAALSNVTLADLAHPASAEMKELA
ncbi:MAG: SUF system Fe-S cluster assembly regulator [Pseudomonadota bacterium]